MSAVSPESQTTDLFPDELDDAPVVVTPLWHHVQQVLAPIASLKLTVALLALGVVVIFFGTLAQTKADIWDVMREYFRAWIMKVPFSIFTPPAFFPNAKPAEGWFPFPGGASIGTLMLINLFAAHIVRFKPSPSRTVGGWALFWLGWLLTLFVVVSGSSGGGVQDKPFIPWSVMWYGVLATIVALCGGSWTTAIYALNATKQTRATLTLALGSAIVAVAATGGLAFIALDPENARLGESSLRIIWQLLQGGVAGLVLLAGSYFVFDKRAGIVVIHLGIGLMMLSEALVSWYAVETQMNIREGTTTNFTRDIRTQELAFIEAADAKFDDVTVIPLSKLEHSAKSGAGISHPLLPVDVKVVKYLQNADLRKVKPGEENLATAGSGLAWIAEERRAGTGTDADSKVDMSAAYVQLTDPKTKKDLGVYLVSIIGTEVGEPEKIEIDGKKYDVALRFKHYNKPYTVKLNEVRQDTYVGTNTAKNYHSIVHLDDPTRKVSLDARIWMNNPLRYGGETFYQSGYREGETTLAVVSNTGWMIPYVSCALVAIGMGFHFVLALKRFLDRGSRVILAKSPPAKGKAKESLPAAAETAWTRGTWIAVGVTAVVFLLFLGRIASPPKVKPNEFDLQKFGLTSVVHEGRVKPIDTLARVMLRIVSDKETFKDENGKTQPAIRWLSDVISGSTYGENHRVVRIEHPQVLALFGLEDRPGSYRYSLAELRKGKFKDFVEQAENAEKKNAENTEKKGTQPLSVYERKILQLANRIKAIRQLEASFSPPPVPRLPTPESMKSDPEALARWRMEFSELNEAVKRMSIFVIPLEPGAKGNAIAQDGAKDGWTSFPKGYLNTFLEMRILGEQGDPAVRAFNELVSAYGQGRDAEFEIAAASAEKKAADPKIDDVRKESIETFHRKTVEFQTLAAKRRPAQFDEATLKLEAYFNHLSPFFYGIWLYFAGFVLVALTWLTGQRKTLGAAAATLITMTFVFHLTAMLLRMYISGRPPVTNLYSSALFIGLGCVALGLILEIVFGRGFGLFTSAVAGFVTLWIALFLSLDGDTMTVLQAVLDTQFWLATHVTCITLGYSTTFLAGALGAVSIARGFGDPSLKDDTSKDLGRMTYGTLCFALFFSFVGTVLGGLWADDSWGRFWGWDPKENGALMIVLWNAIILHARWDKQIAERGIAVLAVLGNIVTAWSWFGVNELGVGLHSYGFTEGRLKYLALAMLVHLLIAAAGVAGGLFKGGDRRGPQPA